MKKLTRLLSILLALVLCLSVCCAGIADETAAVDDETLEAYFTLLFSQIADADPIDWKGFEEEFNAKVAGGAEITMEDCLPAEAWKLFNSLTRMKEDGEVKAENITMTLQYLNADGTVLYERTYTFADLAAAVKTAT